MPKGNFLPKSPHNLNLSAFSDPLSQDGEYWVGFMLADGCVSVKKKTGAAFISLGLNHKDSSHVKAFARYVGVRDESVLTRFVSTSGYGPTTMTSVTFTGKELVPQLARYGVVPRKSLIATVPTNLESSPDFWRGVLDGDGSLSMKGGDDKSYPLLYLCGSLDVVTKFSEYLFRIVGFKPSVSSAGNIFKVGVGGRTARAGVSIIYYGGCSPVLERKMAIADKIKIWQFKAEKEGRAPKPLLQNRARVAVNPRKRFTIGGIRG